MTELAVPSGWALWRRQTLAVARLELRKCFRGRRLIGITLLNLAPVVVLGLTHFVPHTELALYATATNLSQTYAVMFATFMLRAGIFFTAAALTIQLFRNEALEKTLHYYLLSPVRRGIVVAGKFLAAAGASAAICCTAVLLSYLVLFAWLGDAMGRFMFEGPGLGHLLGYLGATALGCLGYAAVFALFGLLWRNPIVSGALLFGWESILFLLPPGLKLASVLFYLEALLPYRPPVGPLAVLAEPPPAALSFLGMLLFTAAVLGLAAWRARRMEIAYSTD
jgi:ABC-type transport system involved in multi-copper enzyme maturation permease subunit